MVASSSSLLKFSFFIIILSSFGCSSVEELEQMQPKHVDNEAIRAYSEKEDSVGRLNAVKKVHQLTDLVFTPKNIIELNSGSLLPDRTYKGMIYSSVKEIETYIGNNVSFHTFMTALNNPRSRIYTEKINVAPYHGVNCKSYYGTVCSDLVSYALGLSPRYNSYDFENSELMELIDDVNPENLKIADVLWKKGHVAIITDIVKGGDSIVKEIEISEAVPPRCRSYYVDRTHFVETVMSSFQKIFRYKEIGGNIEYTVFNEFVAVDDEDKIPFAYNNDICIDKGDRSNYLENEEVIINILNTNAKAIEVYKDDILFLQINIDNSFDHSLKNLTYGNYKARIIIDANKNIFSDFIYWKVINADIKYDKGSSLLYFKSNNAAPAYVIACALNGSYSLFLEGYYHIFTKEELSQGYVVVPSDRLSPSYPYFKVFFETEYGRIIQKPIKWE